MKILKSTVISVVTKQGAKLIYIITKKNKHVKPSLKQCEICKSSFANEIILKEHIRKQHLGEKDSFSCTECNKEFSNKTSLQRHLEVKHEGKEYECNLCSYKSKHHSSVYLHKRSKHGDHRFPCKHCNMQYAKT